MVEGPIIKTSVAPGEVVAKLTYSRENAEYQVHIKPEDRWRYVRHNGTLGPACAMLTGEAGSKFLTDQETGKSTVLYWRTKSDAVAQGIASMPHVDVDESVRQLIEQQLARKVDSRAVEAHLEVPPNSEGLEPFPYQKAGVRWIMNIWEDSLRQAMNIHPLLADEMGLGKTAQALTACLLTKEVRTILIVCPSSVKENWQREIGIWLNTGDPRFCEPSQLHPDGWKIKRNLVTVLASGMRIVPQTQIIIVNYDLLKNKKIYDAISARDWDVLIADETQNVKTPTSARSKVFFSLRAKRKLCMTGTPINKVMDIQSVAGWLYPAKFGIRSSFRNAYEDSYGGPRKLGEDLRASIMIARKKSDVATELPPYLDHIRLLKPNAEEEAMIRRQQSLMKDGGKAMNDFARQLEQYDRWAKKVIAESHGTFLERQVKNEVREKFQQLCISMDYSSSIPFEAMSAERKAIGVMKVPHVIDIIEEQLEAKESLVIFYHHKEVGAALTAKFATITTGFDGSTSEKARNEAIDLFQSGKKRLFIASLRAANSGINLHRSDTLLFAERDWNASENDQAKARIHRTGQRFPCTSISPAFDGSLDARMLQIDAIKSRIAQYVME